jgi:hypothetical protein
VQKPGTAGRTVLDSPSSEAGSTASTVMLPSEGDPIDLYLDCEAAIAPQPKRGPKEHVNIDFHPSRFTPGDYSREQNPLKPYSGYLGIKSMSQKSEYFRKAICDGDGKQYDPRSPYALGAWAPGLVIRCPTIC